MSITAELSDLCFKVFSLIFCILNATDASNVTEPDIITRSKMLGEFELKRAQKCWVLMKIESKSQSDQFARYLLFISGLVGVGPSDAGSIIVFFDFCFARSTSSGLGPIVIASNFRAGRLVVARRSQFSCGGKSRPLMARFSSTMRQLRVFSIQFPLQNLMDVMMSLVKVPVNSYDKLFPCSGYGYGIGSGETQGNGHGVGSGEAQVLQGAAGSSVNVGSFARNIGGASNRVVIDDKKFASPEMPTVPVGQTSPPSGASGSGHGPNWDYNWGWGSTPNGGWGYGSGSGRSPNGFGKGFGYGSGSGSGSGSGYGYGTGSGGAQGGGYGAGSGSGNSAGGGSGGGSGGPSSYGTQSPSDPQQRTNHG
ncbi:hypothetical protein POTOM_043398 [Populus tomentosa]|uniref:Uncharacterized protein n=1 Tax=Populus tomentosa TaxID=118781 RepID=A0A8X7YHF5_POPTO|nr:hypothetical protein POTOM_043398 [Populus tomentosa]